MLYIKRQYLINNSRFSPINTLLQRRKELQQKQWRKCENEYPHHTKNRDFMQFIRIVRVHCTESEDISVSLLVYFAVY